MTSTIVITGGGRGIGAELAKHYKQAGWTVFVTARDPSRVVSPADRVLALDVRDADSVASLVGALDGVSIDILWNNAGVYLDKGVSLAELAPEVWAETLLVNSIMPVKIAQALLPNVAASEKKCLAFTTSRMGSIASLKSAGSYAYRSSKTALNMAVAILTNEAAEFGVSTALFHPGWVRTDMGGPIADIDVATSAGGMKAVMDAHTIARSGAYYNYDGSIIPW